MNPSEYQPGSVSWRNTLQQNYQRTKIVFALFIGIYLLLGIIIDCLLVLQMPALYGVSYAYVYSASLSDIFLSFLYGVVTFKITPYATLTTTIIALLALIWTIQRADKALLMGTNYTEVTSRSLKSEEKQLFNIVEELKIAAGMQYMPRVYIIEAQYMNAFASGFSEHSAMIAITRGLLDKLQRDEIQAVMAHELSHIRHQDIRLTISAAILSNIMLIMIDVLFHSLFYGRYRRVDGRVIIVLYALRIILPTITLLLMMYLSRTREFMADAGAVELMRDNQPMANALIKIHEDHKQNKASFSEDYNKTAHEELRRAAYLYDPSYANLKLDFQLSNIFATHPDLKQRLEALGYVKE